MADIIIPEGGLPGVEDIPGMEALPDGSIATADDVNSGYVVIDASKYEPNQCIARKDAEILPMTKITLVFTPGLVLDPPDTYLAGYLLLDLGGSSESRIDFDITPSNRSVSYSKMALMLYPSSSVILEFTYGDIDNMAYWYTITAKRTGDNSSLGTQYIGQYQGGPETFDIPSQGSKNGVIAGTELSLYNDQTIIVKLESRGL